jgi:hypothetical protein
VGLRGLLLVRNLPTCHRNLNRSWCWSLSSFVCALQKFHTGEVTASPQVRNCCAPRLFQKCWGLSSKVVVPGDVQLLQNQSSWWPGIEHWPWPACVYPDGLSLQMACLRLACLFCGVLLCAQPVGQKHLRRACCQGANHARSLRSRFRQGEWKHQLSGFPSDTARLRCDILFNVISSPEED